jgi:hypothetical protein
MGILLGVARAGLSGSQSGRGREGSFPDELFSKIAKAEASRTLRGAVAKLDEHDLTLRVAVVPESIDDRHEEVPVVEFLGHDLPKREPVVQESDHDRLEQLAVVLESIDDVPEKLAVVHASKHDRPTQLPVVPGNQDVLPDELCGDHCPHCVVDAQLPSMQVRRFPPSMVCCAPPASGAHWEAQAVVPGPMPPSAG